MSNASGVGSVPTTAAVGKVVEEPSGYELWGMRKRHVAVVNLVLGEDPKWTMSLAGEWEFKATDYRPDRNAFWKRFQEEKDWGETRKIRVPGLLETQGVGSPGISRPWDCPWDCSPKPLTHVFRGAAWYRRTFTIPPAWAGRRIWLKIGNVTSQGWFWVNGTQVAWHESYCGTYKYEITDLVSPGKESLFVIEVSNVAAQPFDALVNRGMEERSRVLWLVKPEDRARFLLLVKASLRPKPAHDVLGTCGRDDACECNSCWVRRGGYNKPKGPPALDHSRFHCRRRRFGAFRC